MRRRVIGCFILAVFGFQTFLVSTLWADDSIQKKPVAKSADRRFLDYGDGTILDKKSNLMWMKLDYWLIEKKWVNWYTAKEFAQRMNNKKFAGYDDWRLPTPEEAMQAVRPAQAEHRQGRRQGVHRPHFPERRRLGHLDQFRKGRASHRHFL